MRKLTVVLALAAAACAVVVPTAAGTPGPKGPKAPKVAQGTISILATPSTVTATTTTVAVAGNLKATSSCRKNRTVEFSYTGAAGTTQVGTAVTRPNGDFAATLAKPADVAPATVTLQATTPEVDRKVGGKKKGKRAKRGRKITCATATGTASLTVTP